MAEPAKDTSAAVEAQYRALLMEKSGEERLLMALEMFDTARALVLASFPAGSPIDEVRRRLVARFYPELTRDQLPAELRTY